MSEFRDLPHRIGYALYRGLGTLARLLPLPALFVTGRLLGFLGGLLLFRRRRLATENLRLALGLNPAEARHLARRHFATLGANALSMLKVPSLTDAQVWKHVEFQTSPDFSQGSDSNGLVLTLSHMSNWELLTRLVHLFPHRQFGALYQRLANPRVNAHFNASRARMGVRLFDRKDDFWECARFLESGGIVGVLSDQYAGTAGTWMPFFGRLTSTSTMAAVLARRTKTKIFPVTITTTGLARWRVTVENALPVSDDSPEATTAAINRTLERQITASPTDWLWAHDRWKTPALGFLTASHVRSCYFPTSFNRARLTPFRILLRSVNNLHEAEQARSAVQAVKRGRPDVHLTILAPKALEEFWRAVAGVDAVISIPSQFGFLRTVIRLRQAGAFDAGILLPAESRGAWEMTLAGVPRRLGAPGRSFLNHWHNPPGVSDPPIEGEERYHRIVQLAGAAV